MQVLRIALYKVKFNDLLDVAELLDGTLRLFFSAVWEDNDSFRNKENKTFISVCIRPSAQSMFLSSCQKTNEYPARKAKFNRV